MMSALCPTIRLEAAAGSHTGCVRRRNEDSFAALPDLGLLLVADGMGGRAGGEIASHIAIETVAAVLARTSNLDGAAAALIGRAIEQGGPDNITCVLARCAGG